ncbi:hypothetical protein LPJ73_001240 [Coemansia sp. RSA 2703]|nr:hypothetical protein LPJ73_001240 [Coemansia sp. RSA 2703]KAJ2372939.1 hypothetical protein IW150_003869 [Coemansia sp. RSA 2607]KAJ2394626.1 hypothetical protein GGI05_001954 [Coemansia sp. RSA 2603]
MKSFTFATAALALVHSASAIMYIPTTSIENTQAYYEGVSQNWENVESVLNAQMNSYSSEGNYGAYAVMTSVYGSVPDHYDEGYLKSLLGKLEEVGTVTWDDSQLSSLSASYTKEHSISASKELDSLSDDAKNDGDDDDSKKSGARGLAVSAGSVVIGAAAVLAVALF